MGSNPTKNMDVATKQYVNNNGLTPAIKQALLDCFNNVKWADGVNRQNYYNALRDALGL